MTSPSKFPRRKSSAPAIISSVLRKRTVWIVQKIVLQIGIAIDHPDIAEDFVQHACETPATPFRAQFVQQVSRLPTQQANYEFPIRETRIAVRNLAQTSGHDELETENRQVSGLYRTALQHNRKPSEFIGLCAPDPLLPCHCNGAAARLATKACHDFLRCPSTTSKKSSPRASTM